MTCGGGKQTRTRDVAVPATNGGKACVGNFGLKTQGVLDQRCKRQKNTKDMIANHPDCEAMIVPRNATETKVCEEDVCPVDCVLDDWTAWSSCEPYCLGHMMLIERDLTMVFHGFSLELNAGTLLTVWFQSTAGPVEIPPCLRVPPAGNMTRQRAIKTPPSDGGAACGVLVCNENSLEILKRPNMKNAVFHRFRLIGLSH